METIKEEQKVLIKYLREKDEYSSKVCFDKFGKPSAHLEKIKGRIIGCVVSTNNQIIGWSLINKKDRRWSWDMKEQQEIFKKDKDLAFHIAYNRSLYAENLSKEDLLKYYSKIPDSILEEADKMLERSSKYFTK